MAHLFLQKSSFRYILYSVGTLLLGMSIYVAFPSSGIVRADAINTTDFVTTWKTNNAGTSNSTSITIPMIGGPYDVDWNNDGVYDQTGVMNAVTHDFGVAGTYTVRIAGAKMIFFNNIGDRLKILSVDQWGTSSWTSMYNAFFGCTNLLVPATDTPNFSSVNTMQGMFQNAPLANPLTTNWDTVNVTNMYVMFYGATSANPNTTNWNTSKVTNMSNMFYNATSANPDTTNWDTSKVTSMAGMFYGATSANPNTANRNTANVTNMSNMFYNTTSANPNTTNWNTSKVTNMAGMFWNASLANPNTANWDVSKVVEMSYMFSNADSAMPNTTNWNTSSVTNMYYMFANSLLVNPDTTNWNTVNVVNMGGMFTNAIAANPNTATWDTAKVTNMSSMFNGATVAAPNTTNRNTSKVTTMMTMFRNAMVANPDVSGWDVSKVTDMSYMFENADSATPNVTNWNLSGATSLYYMFANSLLVNPDTTNWNTVNVVNMGGMFTNAIAANPNVTNRNTSKVTNMSNMFYNATSANPNVVNWDVSKVTNMGAIFMNSAISRANYDNALIAFAAQTLKLNVPLGATPKKYCLGEAARQSIIATYGWTITDGGKDCYPLQAPDLQQSSDSGVLDTDNITNIATPTFDLVCRKAGTTLNVYVNGVLNGTHSCVASGVVSYTLSSALVSGLYSIGYREIDGASTSSMSPLLSLTIDRTNPIVTPFATTSLPYSINDPLITFLGTDNTVLDHFEITYIQDNNGGGVDAMTTVITPAVSPLQLDLDPDELVHTVQVVAYDKAGNSTSIDLKFPPIVTFIGPFLSNINPMTTQVTITSPSGNDIDAIVVTDIDAVGATLGTCTGNAGDTTIPYASPVTCDVVNITANGQIKVSARDAVSLAIGQNYQIVTLDTINPVVTITQQTSLSRNSITDTTIQISDNYGVSVANVSLGGATTANTSNFSCTQLDTTHISCTISIDGAPNTGPQTIQLVVTDTAGNTVSSSQGGYIIDTLADAAPTQPDLITGSDTGISPTDNITADNTPTFTIACVDGSTVTLYDNGLLLTPLTVCSGGIATIVPDGYLDDGSHSISSTQTDPAGNESLYSAPLLVVIVDTLAPAIVVQSFGGDTTDPYLTNDSTPTAVIATTAGDTVTIPGFTCTPTPAVGGSVSCVATVPYAPDGAHTFVPTITDTAGNTTGGTAISFTLDTTPDAAPTQLDLITGSDTGISPTDNITADNTPTFTLSCVDGSTVTLYDGATPRTPTAVCSGGTVTITLATPLADGIHNITAIQTDPAGNNSPSSSPLLVVIVDTLAPSIVIQSVGSDTTVPYLTVDTTPDVIVSTQISDTVVVPGFTCMPTPATGSSVVCSPDSAYVSDGVYSFIPTITDSAGNITTGAITSFTIDTTPPAFPIYTVLPTPTSGAITVTLIAVESSITASIPGLMCTPNPSIGGDVTCSGTLLSTNPILTLTDPAGNGTTGTITAVLDTIAPPAPDVTSVGGDIISPYKINDTTPLITGTGEIGSVITVTIGATQYTGIVNGSGNRSINITSGLGEGNYTAGITSTDAAGNTSVATYVSFILDTTLPIATILTPLSGAQMQSLSFLVTFTGTDTISTGLTYLCGIDSGAMSVCASPFSVTMPSYGVHTISVQAIDEAGNGSIVETIAVDCSYPVVGFGGGGGGISNSNGDSSTPHVDTNTPPVDNETPDETPDTSIDTDVMTPGVPVELRDTLYNDTIGTLCYTRGNANTIYEGNEVSMAFRKAHHMIYSYGLTKRQGTKAYRPSDSMTREEAARFMVEYAQNVLCREKLYTYENAFADLGTADKTLQQYIILAYEYGIFKGSKGNFHPKEQITTDELAAVLVRMVRSTFLEEKEADWAGEYRAMLQGYAKTTYIENITRGNIAELMYDVYRNNEYLWTEKGYVIK